MIYTSMLQLIRNGDFGSIRPGMSRNQLRELIGFPCLWGFEEDIVLAQIWRYGDIEFHFINDPNFVTFIYTDRNNFTHGGPNLKIAPWIIRQGLPRDKFEENLRKRGISFVCFKPFSNRNDIKEIMTESGAKFRFEESAKKYLGLTGWTSRWEKN